MHETEVLSRDILTYSREQSARLSHLQTRRIFSEIAGKTSVRVCVWGGLSENTISTQMPADGLITMRARAPARSSKCAEMVFKQDSTLLNPSRLN